MKLELNWSPARTPRLCVFCQRLKEQAHLKPSAKNEKQQQYRLKTTNSSSELVNKSRLSRLAF